MSSGGEDGVSARERIAGALCRELGLDGDGGLFEGVIDVGELADAIASELDSAPTFVVPDDLRPTD